VLALYTNHLSGNLISRGCIAQSDKRAQKKKREETPGQSESERDATPQNHMAGPMMDYEDDSDEEEEEDSNIFGQPYKV
jgi:hypothetical protein